MKDELTLLQQQDLSSLFADFLDPDEIVLGTIKPNKSRFYKNLAFPFAIPLFWPHFILIVVCTLGIFPFVTMAKSYKNLCYAYTNKRLITRSGTFGVSFFGIEYKDIVATSVDTTILDKRTHTGSLLFRSYHSSVRFNCVENPYELMRKIKEVMPAREEPIQQ
ncbi:MAG: PH domain-containing protein [Clostridia bacterium]|nr:PH domain-containing protein [Clostridia bacterium]